MTPAPFSAHLLFYAGFVARCAIAGFALGVVYAVTRIATALVWP